jgi:3-deoxy-manno-octulosonate cytidylyltransferase (CMP-KDO synthetase)
MSEKKSIKTVGIIPARFASTRLPGKPLIQIAGKSLIQRTFENALHFKSLNEIIIATDNQEIFQHAKNFGANVCMTSPNCVNGTERLADVIEQMPHLKSAGYIFNIQGDEPFLDPCTVDEVLNSLASDNSIQVGTAAVKFYSKEEALNPSIVKVVIDKNHRALYFSRSMIPFDRDNTFESGNHYFLRHLGIYCYTPEFLLNYKHLSTTPLQTLENLEQLKILEHGYSIKVAVLKETFNSFGVDTPEDVEKLKHLLESKNR